MGVYLGQAGCVELRRTSSDELFHTQVGYSDVVVDEGADWKNSDVECVSVFGGEYGDSDIDNDIDSVCAYSPTFTDPAIDPGTAEYDDADFTPRSEAAVQPVSNINTGRFSFDFPQGQFITGDLLEFVATDGRNLDFVAADGWYDGKQHPDGMWYINVDPVQSMRLYKTFDEALAGEATGRVRTQQPSRVIQMTVQVRNNTERMLAQVTGFELNTERQAVDVTELGESFRQQYSTLITGSGRVECFFEYDNRMCDGVPPENEMPVYLNQLILRSQIGSEFIGKFTLVKRGNKPQGRAEDFDDQVWYEATCLVTNVSMAFEPTQPVRVVMNFVTTGQITLRVKTISNYLLTEQGGPDSKLRLEPYQSGFLENEQLE